jgi:hypothetical protein
MGLYEINIKFIVYRKWSKIVIKNLVLNNIKVPVMFFGIMWINIYKHEIKIDLP